MFRARHCAVPLLYYPMPVLSPNSETKGILVEDTLLVREMMHIFIAEKLGYQIVGEVATGREAIDLISRVPADFLVLDLQLPDMTGFAMIDECIRLGVHLPKILACSAFCDDRTTYGCDHYGIRSFIYKPDTCCQVFAEAIRKLLCNKIYCSTFFLRRKAERKNNPRSFDKVLTNRQQEVVTLVGELLPDSKIAERLHIAVGTVAKHRFTAGKNLGLKGRRALESYARDSGFPKKL